MAWESRGAGRYYYRARREGRRVVKSYVGAGPLAEAVAELDRGERAALAHARAEAERDRVARKRVDRALEVLGSSVNAALAATLTAAGFHRHNRGEWRRRRRARA